MSASLERSSSDMQSVIASGSLVPQEYESATAQARETAIKVRGLRKSYGAEEAVRGIDLDIARGEIFGLIGPDGAGKTSVFQILGGVMAATAGDVSIFGLSARDARSATGYLTQSFSLYQDLSVSENLRYMGELRKLSPREIEKRGARYLKLFEWIVSPRGSRAA